MESRSHPSAFILAKWLKRSKTSRGVSIEIQYLRMFYVAQVNFGIDIAALIGLSQVILGLVYLIYTIVKLLRTRNIWSNLITAFYIIQLLIVPTILFFSGCVLILQGWRLDPILQFQQFILFLLIVFLIIKEMVINTVGRNR